MQVLEVCPEHAEHPTRGRMDQLLQRFRGRRKGDRTTKSASSTIIRMRKGGSAEGTTRKGNIAERDEGADDPTCSFTSRSASFPAEMNASIRGIDLDQTEHNNPASSTRGYKLENHEIGNLDGFGYLRFHEEEVSTVQEALDFATIAASKPVVYMQADRTSIDIRAAGQAIFGDPLIAEALETFFIPLSVRSANDETGLGQVGFVDQLGVHLIPPISFFKLSRTSFIDTILQVIQSQNQTVPGYLHLLAEEAASSCSDTSTAVCDKSRRLVLFAVEDPSAGEVAFAGFPGVLATQAGLLNRGKKVVQVVYDPKRLSFGVLARFAITRLRYGEHMTVFFQTNDERIAAQVEVARCRRPPCPQVSIELLGHGSLVESNHLLKPALRQTPMRFVPLTPLQSTKANRLIHQGRFDEATHLLSPRQGLILMEATRKGAKFFYDVVDVSVVDGWISASEKTRPTKRREEPEDDESIESDRAPDIYNLLGTM